MLVENLSTNCLLRAYPFAKILDYDLDLIGPVTKNGLFPPIRKDRTINYKPVRKETIFPFYLNTINKIKNKIDGDIVHAFKTTANSFYPALKSKKKIILDIDDWESQYMVDSFLSPNPLSIAKFTLADLYIPESYFIKKHLEKQAKKANAIITSSKTLQRMYGGTWIPTGPDTNYFNPNNFTGKKIREEFNLKDKTVVLFMGTPKKHKGIQELIQAIKVARKDNENIHLLIVGAGKQSSYLNIPFLHPAYTEQLKSQQGITIEGYRDHKEMPEFLAAADIVCIPHKNTKSSNAQLPIKIFEPMSMAKPVITTNTTDMKEIFQDCGTVIRPDSSKHLAQAIINYSNDKSLRNKHGKKARQECIKKYSWKVMKKKTEEVYESIT